VSRIGGRKGYGYISIPEQKRTQAQIAKAYGITLGELLVDEDYSGGNTDRPAFSERSISSAPARRAGSSSRSSIDSRVTPSTF
jgi:hypothetical protein